jgi:hypothetical protein
MTERRAGRLAASIAVATAALAAGRAVAAPSLQFSGSAYVDSWVIPSQQPRADEVKAPQGITVDASMRFGVDVHDTLSFSAKACISCHGVEMDHVVLDWQPKPWFNAQFGRLDVPFGEFANRIDQSGHRTSSAPLIYDMGRMAYADRTSFNSGVIMLPYVDTGLMLYGQVWLGSRVQLWYAGYAVSGFKGTNDVEWMALRTAPYADNNKVPSYGGRFTLTYSSDPGAVIGDVSLGASYTGGRYDRAARLQYDVAGADLSIQLWKLTLRGEYALRRTALDAGATGYQWTLVDAFFDKRGFYGELEHPLGPYVAMIYRYDKLERLGVPLPGSVAEMTPSAAIERLTVGTVITPSSGIYLKLSYEYWKPTGFALFHSGHVGFGGAF